MGMLILEATDSAGEQLASQAADSTGVAMGWAGERRCASFDSDDMDDGKLQAAVYDALAAIDPDWSSQLQVTD